MTTNSLPMQKLIAYLRLARTEGIGPVNYQKFLKHYKTPEAALEILPTLKHTRKPFLIPSKDQILTEIEGTFALSGHFLLHGSPDYPPSLAALPDPPPILTILGNPKLLLQKSVAIVGARNASAHGLRLAESLSSEIAAQQIAIVSGLARGIDRSAHKGALFSGLTIAAIAGGIDKPYPPEHAALQAKIAEQGVIITEAPLGTAPRSTHFPRRNRLIAGICWGCIIIEAALHSGSLITAQQALNYGKVIFAVPGSPLDPRSRGSNHLIRMGAILTETANDVLSELPDTAPLTPPSKSYDKAFPLFSDAPRDKIIDSQNPESLETTILNLLSSTPTPVDELIRRCASPTTNILSILSLLELSEKVIALPAGYILTP